MPVSSMNDLFLTTLKDIYYAEKQIYKSLPKMARTAASPELKQAFEKHHEETEKQIERLETVFEQFGASPRSLRCEAIDGIIAEAKEFMEEARDEDVCDAALIASGQTVEHYEIARYGTLIAWADQLGKKESSELLRETLEEEKKTDRLLSHLAEGRINRRAAA
jgi:ferritin-like metal-binding protein YciE